MVILLTNCVGIQVIQIYSAPLLGIKPSAYGMLDHLNQLRVFRQKVYFPIHNESSIGDDMCSAVSTRLQSLSRLPNLTVWVSVLYMQVRTSTWHGIQTAKRSQWETKKIWLHLLMWRSHSRAKTNSSSLKWTSSVGTALETYFSWQVAKDRYTSTGNTSFPWPN